MKPYRFVAFAAALAITGVLAIAPALMIKVTARHREEVAATQGLTHGKGGSQGSIHDLRKFGGGAPGSAWSVGVPRWR